MDASSADHLDHNSASLESSAAQLEPLPCSSEAVQRDGQQGQQQEAAEQAVESSRKALLILERLQTLPWRRIDVSFEGTNMPFFCPQPYTGHKEMAELVWECCVSASGATTC